MTTSEVWGSLTGMKKLLLLLFSVVAVLTAPACYDAKTPVPKCNGSEQWPDPCASASTQAVKSVDASAPYSPPPITMKYRGTNLSGGEFGSKLPGTYGVDYTYPKEKDVDYFVGTTMNFLRVPFLWERLQKTQNGELSTDDWSKISVLITYANSKGMTVALEPHNSARYYRKLVGSPEVPHAAFANFWGRVAALVKDNPKVMLNLTNEPHDEPTEQWVTSANAAIASIRQAGFNGVILVPGNAYTGSWHWNSTWYGTSNAVAMLKVVDPKNNLVFEVHDYLDSNASGGGKECSSETAGVDRLKDFTSWLRTNKKLGFIGEFAGPNTPLCQKAVQNLVAFVEANYDVFVGWAWWSAGPWWGADYQLSLNPTKDGKDSAMIQWLFPSLPCHK